LKDLNADIVLFQEMETFDGGHVPTGNLQLDWVISTVDGYIAAVISEHSVSLSFPAQLKKRNYTTDNEEWRYLLIPIINITSQGFFRKCNLFMTPV
jgi:hypothetical protein